MFTKTASTSLSLMLVISQSTLQLSRKQCLLPTPSQLPLPIASQATHLTTPTMDINRATQINTAATISIRVTTPTNPNPSNKTNSPTISTRATTLTTITNNKTLDNMETSTAATTTTTTRTLTQEGGCSRVEIPAQVTKDSRPTSRATTSKPRAIHTNHKHSRTCTPSHSSHNSRVRTSNKTSTSSRTTSRVTSNLNNRVAMDNLSSGTRASSMASRTGGQFSESSRAVTA